ncbi:hypothetical protein [Pseudomonas aeruginosa]|uniref:hypothetical protein n=1 Tax=Pseudomonas aeruginosa TaxID=287 RepID=UPI00070A9654|nr:hypothetical protein [Pseudomonas aeruginosa]MCO3840206.1 hypothetical protein [Pseudomonas aeruginosa]NPW39382.1 hypothetical protein [Pseudomonas aeruginosa]HBP1183222.1 hypothetical protein [Pseudomonas aeruginosa]HCF2456922.1 hypothetical protein [Pseudomonas aeruginosa]HCL4171535.1 hypothetical protein [Pseudomonas aeruginosa]
MKSKQAARASLDRLSDVLKQLVASQDGGSAASRTLIDAAISHIDVAVEAQLREILRHSDFRQLQSFLADHANTQNATVH